MKQPQRQKDRNITQIINMTKMRKAWSQQQAVLSRKYTMSFKACPSSTSVTPVSRLLYTVCSQQWSFHESIHSEGTSSHVLPCGESLLDQRHAISAAHQLKVHS